MNEVSPEYVESKNMFSTYNEGIQSQIMNGYENSMIKQQKNAAVNQSIISPTNELVFQNKGSKLFTRSEILNDIIVDQNGKIQMKDSDKKQLVRQSTMKSGQISKSQSLRRTQCIVKDEKTVLSFATLYVSKFIRRIKAVSSLLRFKEMGQSQFRIIEDPASDYNYYYMRGAFNGEAPSVFDIFWHKFFSNNKQIQYEITCSQNKQIQQQQHHTVGRIQHRNILDNSFSRLIWITFMFIVLLTNLIYIPLKYSFDFTSYGEYKWLAYYVPQFAFILEIFVTFFTAIYRKGLIITKKKIIFHDYTKGRLLTDIFFLTMFMVGLYTNYYSDLVIVLRAYDIFSILREIDERFQFRGRIANAMELFKLIFFIILFAHFIACSWHKIGVLGLEEGKVTWMTTLKNDSIPDSTYDFYITSLYWAVVTMITLGYGDIVPKNTQEKLFVIFITQLSCILFAYSMNSIGEILKEMGRKKIIFKHQMSLIDTYMRKRGLNQLTQVKVRKYFEYLNKESLEDNEKSSQLIQNLPQTLKEEVYSDVYGRVLNQNKIFHLHFSPIFLQELSLRMKERRLGPEEILFKEHELSDSIYIVMKGKVQMQQRNNRNLKTLIKGDLFGEMQFFSDQTSEYTAVTSNVTSLAVLSKKDFLDVLNRFPKDHEQYCYMKDRINLCQNIEGLDHKCVSCGSYTHTIRNCQYVNFVRNKQKLLKLFNKNPEQKRQIYFRKRLKKGQKTILKQQQVYDSVVKQIFLASKSAKTQDLQEELSDLDSEISYTISNHSIQEENDEVEISRAAISMISSISPQFAQDFFSKSKYTRTEQREMSNKYQQKKVSQFARFNREDDFNLRKTSTIDEEIQNNNDDENNNNNNNVDKNNNNNNNDKSILNYINNKIQINPSEAMIISKENRINQSIQIDKSINQNIDNTNSLKINNHNNNDDGFIQSNTFKEEIKEDNFLSSDNILNHYNQISQSTEENLLTSATPSKSRMIPPKLMFLNLKRPKDPKLEQLKRNQIQHYLESSSEQIISDEQIQKKEKSLEKKDKSYEKKESIMIQQQDSEYQIPESFTEKQIRYQQQQLKGDALRNFALDFSKASSIHYQSSSFIPLESNKHITKQIQIKQKKQFNEMLSSPKNNNIINNNNIDAQSINPLQEFMPLNLPESKDESFLKDKQNSQSSLKSYKIKSAATSQNNLSKFKSEKDLAGYLSPIPRIQDNSPMNFMQGYENSIKNDQIIQQQNIRHHHHHHHHPKSQQHLRHANSIRFNQISEELQESSHINSKNNSFSDQKNNNYGHDQIIEQSEDSDHSNFSKKQKNSIIDPVYPTEGYDSIDQSKKRKIHFPPSLPQTMNIDKMKYFDIYFPEQNYDKTILKYNTFRRKLNGYRQMKYRKKSIVKKKLAMFHKLHL